MSRKCRHSWRQCRSRENAANREICTVINTLPDGKRRQNVAGNKRSGAGMDRTVNLLPSSALAVCQAGAMLLCLPAAHRMPTDTRNQLEQTHVGRLCYTCLVSHTCRPERMERVEASCTYASEYTSQMHARQNRRRNAYQLRALHTTPSGIPL